MTQWPEKFITPARALKLAGEISLKTDMRKTEEGHDLGPGVEQVHLCCLDCGQSVMLLATQQDWDPQSEMVYTTVTPENVLSAALRHRVMAHNLVLSGAGNG